MNELNIKDMCGKVDSMENQWVDGKVVYVWYGIWYLYTYISYIPSPWHLLDTIAYGLSKGKVQHEHERTRLLTRAYFKYTIRTHVLVGSVM